MFGSRPEHEDTGGGLVDIMLHMTQRPPMPTKSVSQPGAEHLGLSWNAPGRRGGLPPVPEPSIASLRHDWELHLALLPASTADQAKPASPLRQKAKARAASSLLGWFLIHPLVPADSSPCAAAGTTRHLWDGDAYRGAANHLGRNWIWTDRARSPPAERDHNRDRRSL